MFFSRREGERISDNRLSYNLIIISALFLAFISSIFVGSSLLFICKIPITKLNFVIFPIITMILAKFILNKDRENLSWGYFIFSLVAFYLLVIVLALLNNFIWDSSYDSLGYHQEAVFRLKEGWNPFYQFKENMNTWVMHYTKASPVFAAALYSWTGRIEGAKILTSLLPVILFIMSFGFFNLITKNKKRKIVLIAALLLAFNPVVLQQIFSYYVDSLLGVYIILLLMIVYLILFTEGLFFFKYFSLVNIAIFLINIKFTGLAYAGVILVGFLIISIIYNKKQYNIKLFSFLIFGLIFSVIIIGFNPYVTNTITNKHPLYPLAGKNKVDIMTTNTPEAFRYDNPFVQAVKANVALPSIANQQGELPKKILDIFKIDENVLYYYSTTDPRVRGFGVYSLIFMPISFIALIYILLSCKNKKLLVSSLITMGMISFAMIYGGDFWWARYVPYLFIIPIIVATLFAVDYNKNLKKIGNFLFGIMIVNSIIIAGSSVVCKIYRSEVEKNYILNGKETLIIEEGVFCDARINKAKEYKINYEVKKVN